MCIDRFSGFTWNDVGRCGKDIAIKRDSLSSH